MNKNMSKYLRLPNKLFIDSNLKKQLRIIYYNFLYRKSNVKYAFQREFYTAEVDLNRLKFFEEPFGIHKLIDEYNKYYMLNTGDVVIDAGAYIGQYSIWAAKKIGDKGKLVSIEPDKYNFVKLCSNIRLNQLRNVVTSDKLLWDVDGTIPFSRFSSLVCILASGQ